MTSVELWISSLEWSHTVEKVGKLKLWKVISEAIQKHWKIRKQKRVKQEGKMENQNTDIKDIKKEVKQKRERNLKSEERKKQGSKEKRLGIR